MRKRKYIIWRIESLALEDLALEGFGAIDLLAIEQVSCWPRNKCFFCDLAYPPEAPLLLISGAIKYAANFQKSELIKVGITNQINKFTKGECIISHGERIIMEKVNVLLDTGIWNFAVKY